jgi:hypothetical protein
MSRQPQARTFPSPHKNQVPMIRTDRVRTFGPFLSLMPVTRPATRSGRRRTRHLSRVFAPAGARPRSPPAWRGRGGRPARRSSAAGTARRPRRPAPPCPCRRARAAELPAAATRRGSSSRRRAAGAQHHSEGGAQCTTLRSRAYAARGNMAQLRRVRSAEPPTVASSRSHPSACKGGLRAC